MPIILSLEPRDGILRSLQRFSRSDFLFMSFEQYRDDATGFEQDLFRNLPEAMVVNRVDPHFSSCKSFADLAKFEHFLELLGRIPKQQQLVRLGRKAFPTLLYQQWEWVIEQELAEAVPHYYYGLPYATSPFSEQDETIIRTDDPTDLLNFKPGIRKRPFGNKAIFEFARPEGVPVSVLVAGQETFSRVFGESPDPDVHARIRERSRAIAAVQGCELLEFLWFASDACLTFAMMSSGVESWGESDELHGILENYLY